MQEEARMDNERDVQDSLYKREPICPGCDGQGQIAERTQPTPAGDRRETLPCPVCHGSGHATQAEAEAWYARTFTNVPADDTRNV